MSDAATIVRLPSVFPKREGSTVLQSRSRSWADIAPQYRMADRVVVPDWLFDPDHRVDDEGAYLIGSDYSLRSTAGRPVAHGAIVFLLESPHRDEFREPGGAAIGPLRNQVVRGRFERHMPLLLESAAERTGVDVVGRQLALVNAVQYQASLSALMADPSSGLRSAVRNAVWKNVFLSGGEQDLIGRLKRYDPAMILVAVTAAVREFVLDSLRRCGPRIPTCRVSAHPSGWYAGAPQLREAVYHRE